MLAWTHIVGNLIRSTLVVFILVTYLLNIFSSCFIFPIVAETPRCASKYCSTHFFHYKKRYMSGQLYNMFLLLLLLDTVMWLSSLSEIWVVLACKNLPPPPHTHMLLQDGILPPRWLPVISDSRYLCPCVISSFTEYSWPI